MQQTAYFDDKTRKALVLCDNPERRADLTALATACQCNVVEASGEVYPDGVDFLICDLRTETDHLSQPISKMVRYLENNRSTVLIWADMHMLETFYAAFSSGQAHFLVDADDAEAVPILAGVFGQRAMNQVHDNDRDVQFIALHRISDELAGFARTLARIAEQDARSDSGVADKPVSFRPAPMGLLHPFPSASPDEEAAPSAKMIREMIKLRRLRDSYFAADLFADPAWDILLDLMVARLEECPVSVSSLCIAAAVPPTTALRWITAMTDSGMLVRQNDPDDARRVFIGLSSETEAALRQYLATVQQRFIPAV